MATDRNAADLKKNELKRGTLRQNNNSNSNINNNNSVDKNKSNGSISSSRPSLASNPSDGSGGSKAQKNNTSLVREGYSSFGNNNSNNTNRARGPRPKAKVQPTRRGPHANTEHQGNTTTSDGRDDARDGDVDSRNNIDGSEVDDGSDTASMNLKSADNYNHRNSENSGTGSTPRGYGSKAGNKVKTATDPPSVRQRFYETADMDDVLQDKIATQLRENGVAETRVASLSAKIAQAVRDDVMGERKASHPQVVSNLSSSVNNYLDVILHNHHHHTDLNNLRPNDAAAELSQMVLMRIAQIHEELATTKSDLESALQTSKRAKHSDNDNTTTALTPRGGGAAGHTAGDDPTTPRDHQEQRSMVMAIKDGIDEQKTELEILEDKLKRLENDREEIETLKQKHDEETQLWDEENLQLKKYLTEADQDNETLVSKVKEQQQEYDKLDKKLQASQKKIQTLLKQIDDLVNQGHVSLKDLAALQTEKSRLQVLCDQRQKEIIHLRDPDRDLLYQIRALKEEVTALRTETRRLTGEKGMLKAKVQKMEAALDESLKQRNKTTSERDALFKEIQEVRQKYRVLTLATPQQRTLPEIMTPRTRPTSRATTLLATRANSRIESNLLVVKNGTSEDSSASKLPTHTEEETAEEEQDR